MADSTENLEAIREHLSDKINLELEDVQVIQRRITTLRKQRDKIDAELKRRTQEAAS